MMIIQLAFVKRWVRERKPPFSDEENGELECVKR